MLPSLRVQIVLYQNAPDALKQSIEAVFNALEQSASFIGGWKLAIGDSSPESLMSQDLRRYLEESLASRSAGSYSYDFFDKNLGHGGGHNRLHTASDEDLLLILNPDGVIAPDCIRELVGSLEASVGVVDARQLPLEHPKKYDPQTGYASWSSLACALTRSETFRNLGGLDHETFFMYCDDVDYSWRVRLSGLEARYCPQARMFHDKRLDSLGVMSASDSELYYSVEAAFMLAYKYSRPDILEERIAEAKLSQDPIVQRALQTFEDRQRQGQLPLQIDPENEIADFTGRTYGEHRF